MSKRTPSPDTIRQRNVTRKFNALFLRKEAPKRTGRQSLAIRRMCETLTKKSTLSPVDKLRKYQEILNRGATRTECQKLGVHFPRKQPMDPAYMDAALEVHNTFDLSPRAWVILGLDAPRQDS